METKEFIKKALKIYILPDINVKNDGEKPFPAKDFRNVGNFDKKTIIFCLKINSQALPLPS